MIKESNDKKRVQAKQDVEQILGKAEKKKKKKKSSSDLLSSSDSFKLGSIQPLNPIPLEKKPLPSIVLSEPKKIVEVAKSENKEPVSEVPVKKKLSSNSSVTLERLSVNIKSESKE